MITSACSRRFPAEARAAVTIVTAARGAVISIISAGSRIATERQIGWTRQLRITPLRIRACPVAVGGRDACTKLSHAAPNFDASSRAGKREWPGRRAGPAAALLGVVGLAVALVLAPADGALRPGGVRASGTAATARGPLSGTRHKALHRSATTFLGPDGVESPAIIDENKRPGTTAWKIGAPRWSGYVQGFLDTTDAVIGQRVGAYVSTTARSFRVIAYRMGWYGGDGARQIWESGRIEGKRQPACPVTPEINMVSCDNWSRSLTVTITRSFVPGDYLFKLVGSGGQESYMLLTVSDPSSHAAYLLIARSMTEQGWNAYGGYDFYQGEGPCTFGTTATSYPACNRARVVSFDRPYADGDGAADFLTEELPLVELMECHGLDVAYTTDVAVSEDPALLLGHRAILSPAHDETWTYQELNGVNKAIAAGENVAFLSAAAIVRHARLQSSPLGPDREVVDYRDAAEDPLNGKASPMEVTGNTWLSPPTSYSVTSLVGELYSGYLDPGTAAPFVVYDAKSWIFAGTALHDGSEIPEVIASDIDHVAPGYPMPSNLEVLGHSPVPLSEAYTNQGQWGGDTYSDMTYYTDPISKAGIFDSGTVNWITTLTECPLAQASCPSGLTQRITGNLLRLFGQGPAGRREPSVANWKSVTPSGS